MPCKHTNHWIISVLCVYSQDIGIVQCEAPDTEHMFKKQQRQLTDHAPTDRDHAPTDIGHAPLQLPASWLIPNTVPTSPTCTLHSFMLHQLFDDTFCSIRLGHKSSQCDSFQYIRHMCSHIQLGFFSLSGDFS